MGETRLDTIKEVSEQFQKIQRFMLLAQKENATETYEALKIEYHFLKALLQTADVSLTDIDIIKA